MLDLHSGGTRALSSTLHVCLRPLELTSATPGYFAEYRARWIRNAPSERLRVFPLAPGPLYTLVFCFAVFSFTSTVTFTKQRLSNLSTFENVSLAYFTWRNALNIDSYTMSKNRSQTIPKNNSTVH